MIRLSFLSVFAIVGLVGQPVAGQVSDQPAAVVTFPYVTADPARGIDTVVQLSNACEAPVRAQCFYENTTSHCCGASACSVAACRSTSDCAPLGACVAGWVPIPFPSPLVLTAQQPLGWRLSLGLPALPLAANAGTVPPPPELPFVGALRCVSIDNASIPVADSCLVGTATIETYQPAPQPRFDVARYNAVGSGPIPGMAQTDRVFSSSFGTISVPFVYDDVTDPVTRGSTAQTTLVLLMSSVDLNGPSENVPGTYSPTPTVTATPTPGSPTPTFTSTPTGTRTILQEPSPTPRTVVSLIVFNEFEQRVSTSVALNRQLIRPLSNLDTPVRVYSIFNVGVGGTVSGKLVAVTVGNGQVALALETQHDVSDTDHVTSAFRGVQGTGLKATPDVIILWSPTPTGTATHTATPTATPTRSATPTITGTATKTSTPTASPSTTQTPTRMPTRTASESPTLTWTATRTATRTPTSTPTESPTRTATNTPSATASRTPTNTPTAPPTATPSRTSSAISTGTVTATGTATSSPTQTPTYSATATSTQSHTPTSSPTSSATQTFTTSPTETAVPTVTPTSTVTASQTETATPSETPTFSPTHTATSTETITPTLTAASTATPINTPRPCAGNCNGDTKVSTDELLALVNISLGRSQPQSCPSGIPIGTEVDVRLVVRAVNNAANSCSP